MAYHRSYIEQCEAYGWAGGPEFKTNIVQMSNGRERRNSDWSKARHRYTLPFQNIGQQGYNGILQMFYVCGGQRDSFLYTDPLNNEATNQLFGGGNGTRTEYQLSTLWTLPGGFIYQRNVYAIRGAITVTINNVPTTAYTLDPDRGTIVFDSPPANGALLRWSGGYDVWVRFASDWLPFSIDNHRSDGFAINGSVELMEVAPPPEETS